MARPTKPATILKMEGKSHKTKAELAFREQGESALLTGYKITESAEVKENPVAHAEFQRVTMLMEQIGKNDELYGSATRRYCLSSAELVETRKEIADLVKTKGETDDIELKMKMDNTILRLKQYTQQLKNELTKFENDNGMTMASSLRMIPKKPEKATNPILEALSV